jgi:hypothetical protein
MEVLREKNLYAKLKKCELWLEEVAFLGNMISKDRVSLDPRKIEAIVEWERPSMPWRFIIS